jgi:hypothetical protein
MTRKLRAWRALPPRSASGAYSTSRTEAPLRRAASAAQSAALPPPMTATSMVCDTAPAVPRETCCRMAGGHLRSCRCPRLARRRAPASRTGKGDNGSVSPRAMSRSSPSKTIFRNSRSTAPLRRTLRASLRNSRIPILPIRRRQIFAGLRPPLIAPEQTCRRKGPAFCVWSERSAVRSRDWRAVAKCRGRRLISFSKRIRGH